MTPLLSQKGPCRRLKTRVLLVIHKVTDHGSRDLAREDNIEVGHKLLGPPGGGSNSVGGGGLVSTGDLRPATWGSDGGDDSSSTPNEDRKRHAAVGHPTQSVELRDLPVERIVSCTPVHRAGARTYCRRPQGLGRAYRVPTGEEKARTRQISRDVGIPS